MKTVVLLVATKDDEQLPQQKQANRHQALNLPNTAHTTCGPTKYCWCILSSHQLLLKNFTFMRILITPHFPIGGWPLVQSETWCSLVINDHHPTHNGLALRHVIMMTTLCRWLVNGRTHVIKSYEMLRYADALMCPFVLSRLYMWYEHSTWNYCHT